MPVESDADRLAFLGDWNDPASYTPAGGSATDLPGVFDEPFDLAMDGGGGPGIGSSLPQFQCRTSDVASDPTGDTLVVDGVTYRIARHEPDGTGMTILFLEQTS